jgi:hypothetical protein
MKKNFCNQIIKKGSKVFTDILIVSRMSPLRKPHFFKMLKDTGSPEKWIMLDRQWKLRLYTDRPCDRL